MSIKIENTFTLHWRVLDNTKAYMGHIRLTEEEVKNLDFDALLVRQTEEYNKVIDARKIRAEQAALETPTDTFTV
jgi:hypothetical protein